ncbi:hypothetical protein [Nitrospira sp. Nam74]
MSADSGPTIGGFLALFGTALGGVMMALGLYTRFTGLALITLLLLGLGPLHMAMEWPTQEHIMTAEVDILLLVMNGALVIDGGGKWSLDARAARRNRHRWEDMYPYRIVVTRIG